jgi:arylsulfatase A-like enzyme
VIFISIDTARADFFGFMGNKNMRTPGLDALALQSIVFTDYMTVVPTTLASHTTLFTGKYPMNHGTPRNGFIVSGENEMLAEILGAAGFHTVGFAGSFALGERFQFAQGFDHYDQEFSTLEGDAKGGQNQRRAEEVTDAVISYLDDTGVPDHLFLFVHYFDPHRPYVAPPPFDRLYDPRGGEGVIQAEEVESSTSITLEQVQENAMRLSMQYASEISYTDAHIARLLQDLNARGVLDESLIVLTSDHGECMWEHGEEFNHGETVYQATMHALCVVRLPGAENGGARDDRPISSIDVLPTVLGLLGLEEPEGVDGEAIDLRDLDAPGAPRLRFGEATKPFVSVETDPRWTNILKARCVRAGPHKYVWTPYNGRRELYDVSRDYHEVRDLLSSPDDEAEAIAVELHGRLLEWTDSADPLPSEFDPSQAEESIMRLKSLGYLQ